jgi:hypothetical protein
MVTDANAARRSSDGERKIQIADWKPHSGLETALKE